MAEFQREKRYIVFKISDIDRCTTPDEVNALLDKVSSHVSAMRMRLNRPGRQYLVIEDDWPEYEVAWQMIQARMEGHAPDWLLEGVLPDEHGLWWYDDGDQEPYPIEVRFDHGRGTWIAIKGQHGWNRDVPLTELSGRWMRLVVPAPSGIHNPN